MNQFFQTPRSGDRFYEIIAYNFPSTKQIYWGPNQRITETLIYVEPTGWFFNEILTVPKVVRFISDAGSVDVGGGGGGGVELSYFNCGMQFSPNDPGTGLNQCIDNTLSWTGQLAGVSTESIPGDFVILFSTEFIAYGYYVFPIRMCDNNGFGVFVGNLDIGQLISQAYFVNPTSYTVYHWSNGVTTTSILVDGLVCPVGSAGGTGPSCPEDYPEDVPCQ